MGRCTGVPVQLSGNRCNAGVIRPGEGTTHKGGDQWGNPRPMEGEPSNTHCRVHPSSKRGSGVSILTSILRGRQTDGSDR